MTAADLVVIGGGLVGGAIAWGAARLGLEVALLDEGDTAFRAARGNFGLVWIEIIHRSDLKIDQLQRSVVARVGRNSSTLPHHAIERDVALRQHAECRQ